jgi:hypothetical protein
MYSYYTLSLLKIDFIKSIKKYLTILQISQLLFLFSAFFLYKNVESTENWNLMLLCGFANIIQIFLFIDFYNKTYNKNKLLNNFYNKCYINDKNI